MADTDMTRVMLPMDLFQDDLMEYHDLPRHPLTTMNEKTDFTLDFYNSIWNKGCDRVDATTTTTTTTGTKDRQGQIEDSSFQPHDDSRSLSSCIWSPPDQRWISFSADTYKNDWIKRDQGRRHSVDTTFQIRQEQLELNKRLLDHIDTYFSTNLASTTMAVATTTTTTTMNTLYSVQFKLNRTELCYAMQDVAGVVAVAAAAVGDWVIVEADRGQDLGKIVHKRTLHPSTTSHKSVQNVKRIYRLATMDEMSFLASQSLDEERALISCQAKIHQRNLPMQIVHAEYQWDRRKLTFYFVADQRVDFREVVRELFKIYKTRIWMCDLKSITNPSLLALE